MDTETVEMQHTLRDIGNVGATDSHLRPRVGELLQPQRDVLHHILVATALRRMDDAVLVRLRLLPHAVQVVLLLRPVDGDADTQVLAVLFDKILNLRRVVVDAVS